MPSLLSLSVSHHHLHALSFQAVAFESNTNPAKVEIPILLVAESVAPRFFMLILQSYAVFHAFSTLPSRLRNGGADLLPLRHRQTAMPVLKVKGL